MGVPVYKLRFKAKSTHIEKAKEALLCNIQDQLVMTIFVLISKVNHILPRPVFPCVSWVGLVWGCACCLCYYVIPSHLVITLFTPRYCIFTPSYNLDNRLATEIDVIIACLCQTRGGPDCNHEARVHAVKDHPQG